MFNIFFRAPSQHVDHSPMHRCPSPRPETVSCPGHPKTWAAPGHNGRVMYNLYFGWIIPPSVRCRSGLVDDVCRFALCGILLFPKNSSTWSSNRGRSPRGCFQIYMLTLPKVSPSARVVVVPALKSVSICSLRLIRFVF